MPPALRAGSDSLFLVIDSYSVLAGIPRRVVQIAEIGKDDLLPL